MSIASGSDVEIGALILNCRVELGLTTTGPSLTLLHFLVLGLRIVSGWVLAKDEVGATELVHLRSSLLFRVESATLLVP